MPRADDIILERVATIRDFHRFYVSRMGFLNRQWTNMMSLTEARVIHEIYIRPSITATEIVRLISIDGGYLSRVLRKFETGGFIARKNAVHDKRQRVLTITPKGRKMYDAWSKIAQENVLSVLLRMSDDEQVKMVDALMVIRDLILNADDRAQETLTLIKPGF